MRTLFETIERSSTDDGTYRRLLRGARALRGATRATRDGLLQIAEPRRGAKRAMMFIENELADRVYLVTEGRVRLERTGRSGRTVHVGHAGPGDLIGDLALVGGPGDESAIAAEETVVLSFSSADLRELSARDVGVVQALAIAITERQRIAEERLEGLMRCDVTARLARFLLFAAERWGKSVEGGVLIATALRHHEVAAMIGAGREWVTMTFAALRQRRVLGAQGRRFILRDMEAMRTLAAGGKL